MFIDIRIPVKTSRNMPLKFELLCIDQEEKVKFKKHKNFILSLSIIESLWISDSLIGENPLEINDNKFLLNHPR
jgi:hypothetical protein